MTAPENAPCRRSFLAKGRRTAECAGRAARGAAFLAVLFAAWPAWAAYRVQQGDTIEVSVAGIPELRQRTTVQPDGAIAFPLAGAVAVEGLTPSELRATVQAQLARKIYRLRGNDGREILTVIQAEDVSAAIVGYRPIYVTGDVAKPGEQTFWPDMTVRQALALAGGIEPPEARLPRPSRDLAALKSDRELAFVELALATAKIARAEAELNGQSDLVGLDLSDLPLPRERLAEIQKSETAILQARMADYQREHDFFKSAIDQSDDRIGVIQKQQAEEEEGSRADTVELHRLVDLLAKGQETNPRITDARRALLLSSTRVLQVNVELLELKRQKAESAHALQHFEDDRRVALLKELQDAAIAQATARIKIEVVDSDLRSLPHGHDLYGIEQIMQQTIEVVRRSRENPMKSVVDDDFVLTPGDVISVSVTAPEKSADSGRRGGP